MSAETPLKCADGSTEEKTGCGQQQSSADLKEINPLITIHHTNDANKSTTEHDSPTKCPESDISPSKAKNRRRNDAKKRSANLKKQTANFDIKQQQKSSTQTSPKKQTSSIGDRILNPSDTNTPVQFNKPTQTSEENYEGVDKGLEASSDIRRDKQLETAKEKLKELKELKEQTKSKNFQLQSLNTQVKEQASKIKELETILLTTTKTCNQLDGILQKELANRASLEAENLNLNQTILRLKAQLTAHEKSKFNNDELVRVLNATLMERETEVSILKLKLTRIQTNPSSTLVLDTGSNMSLIKNDPCRNYSSTGRSNSEFDRNSYIRSSMIAEAASVRASTSQLKSCDKDASVWAKVPEELTPSRRPQILEVNLESTYGDSHYNSPYSIVHLDVDSSSTSLTRDRRYKSMPRSMRNNSKENFSGVKDPIKNPYDSTSADAKETSQCQVTNLDDSNNTSHSSGNKTNTSSNNNCESKQKTSFNYGDLIENTNLPDAANIRPQDTRRTGPLKAYTSQADHSPYSTIDRIKISSNNDINKKEVTTSTIYPPSLPDRAPENHAKVPTGLKRILHRFRRAESSSSSQSKTDLTNSPRTAPSTPFKRGGNRSTTVGAPSDIRAQMTPIKQVMNFQTDKPFAEWDTDMLIDWLTMIGLSMYTAQCRRWVKCGAHIMNATPTEVDKGLGITNHLHRKKLRLAISELNGDCDKVTKAAARLDYLWVARWLDDIGLPQYKEAFINARVDGRVLNYLTVEDLVSMGVKSVMHHASIRCGIRVLRSINFDLQLLKRRATSEEVEHMNLLRQQVNLITEESNELKTIDKREGRTSAYESDVPLWTCHRIMEWLRLIDFAEFAPNLRGSGVHGGLVVFEDGFNIDTMCSVLSIPNSRTLLRRHLSSYFISLMGTELVQRKRQFQDLSSNQQLNPMAEIKTPKKSQIWFTKLKGSKVGQDGLDEYLCPMYPVEPQIIKSKSRKTEGINRNETQPLSNIPESVNV